MTCPRCGNEWDVTKSPCSRCGLIVRLPNNLRTGARSASPTTKQESGPAGMRQATGEPSATPPVASSRYQGDPLNSDSSPLSFGKDKSAGQQSTGAMPVLGNSSRQDLPKPQSPMTTGRMQPQIDNTDIPDSEPLSSWSFSFPQQPVQKSVPPRPPMTPPVRNIVSEAAQPGLRAKRLVTNASQESAQAASEGRSDVALDARANNAFRLSSSASGQPVIKAPHMLLPGTLLRNGRYQLREMLNRQEWQEGVYEASWQALDAQRGGAQVTITEVVVPEETSMAMQSMLRTATMVLTSVGRNPHIPTLWDAFSDQGRSFFVFEPLEGESLSMRMKRTGRALSEQEVIECALEIIEILEFLSQQIPPLVHGLIRPEHILIGRGRNQYNLVNFSIILAGGATQFLSNLEHGRTSAYMSPEFARGIADGRSDLYALIASLYHAVTGSVPSASGPIGTVPSAQRLNPLVSVQMEMILAKGLRPIVAQRYQRPAELRQDLLMIRSVSPGVVQKSMPPVPTSELSLAQLLQSQNAPASSESAAQLLPSLLSNQLVDEEQEQKLLLPRPEDLPPLVERNSIGLSLFWLLGIIVCISLIVFFSRPFS